MLLCELFILAEYHIRKPISKKKQKVSSDSAEAINSIPMSSLNEHLQVDEGNII